MSTAHSSPAARRLGWALAVAALAATVAWSVSLQAGGTKAKKLDLTPDLSWIPPDATVFAQFRAADLWESAPVKVLRKRLGRELERLERDLEEFLLVPVAEAAKVVIVFNAKDIFPQRDFRDFRDFKDIKGFKDLPPGIKVNPPIKVDPKPAPKEPPPPQGFGEQPQPGIAIDEDGRRGEGLWIVTATKAAAFDRLREAIKQGGETQKHKGKTYHVIQHRGRQAVHFINDRTVARGSIRAIKEGLERTTRADSGALAPALEKALGKHHLVVGGQLDKASARELVRALGEMRGLRRTLAPLAAAKSGVLWGSAAKETTLELELHFPDATTAKRGFRAGQDGLTLLRIIGLGEGIEQMERQLADGFGDEEKDFFMLKFLERIETALLDVRGEQRNTRVHFAATADTDLVTLDAKLPELLKAHSGLDDQTRLRKRTANNLRQIVIALHNVHDTYKRFPPPAILSKDGKPLLSWRVAILPYIEQQFLYQAFKLDEPWDSPNNIKLLEGMPQLYAPVGVKTKEPHSTFYRAFVPAPGNQFTTAWQSNRNPNGPTVPFGAWGGRMPAAFPDGTSNTIMVVEAGEAVPWTKPDELVYHEKKALPKLGGLFPNGFHVGMGDASVFFVERPFDEPTLRNMITANDGQIVDLRKVIRDGR